MNYDSSFMKLEELVAGQPNQFHDVSHLQMSISLLDINLYK